MTHTHPGRPDAREYLPYYDTYIRLAPDGDIREILDRQIDETAASLSSFTAEQAEWRPALGEWNAVEIVGHLADSERVFAYRAFSFARNDPAPLPGMDPDGFMAGANFADRSLTDVVAEFVADGNPISVRALAYIMAGHESHHARDFPRHRAMGGETVVHDKPATTE